MLPLSYDVQDVTDLQPYLWKLGAILGNKDRKLRRVVTMARVASTLSGYSHPTQKLAVIAKSDSSWVLGTPSYDTQVLRRHWFTAIFTEDWV